MTHWYVYAYDIYGGVTYFVTSDSQFPKAARGRRADPRALESVFTKIAAKKLGVSEKNVRLAKWDYDPFKQEHIPERHYREGKWVSGTWD